MWRKRWRWGFFKWILGQMGEIHVTLYNHRCTWSSQCLLTHQLLEEDCNLVRLALIFFTCSSRAVVRVTRNWIHAFSQNTKVQDHLDHDPHHPCQPTTMTHVGTHYPHASRTAVMMPWCMILQMEKNTRLNLLELNLETWLQQKCVLNPRDTYQCHGKR